MRLKRDRPQRSLWQKIKDVAMTDVSVLVHGIDEESIDRLERVLLEADFGVQATMDLVDELQRAATRGKVSTEADLRDLLGERIREILDGAATGAADGAATVGDAADEVARAPGAGDGPPTATRGADGAPTAARAAGGVRDTTAAGAEPTQGPFVTLLLGVNGTGKTTTAAKLARRHIRDGGDIVLAATDTFRSGAQEQLRIWAERVGAEFVGGQPGGDPASVAYDAAEAAKARGARSLIVDTAGRLHTQRGLLEELEKIDRVLGRRIAGAPHSRLLVVDATSGQNVLAQVREFGRALELTGIVLTKYDSSARGGTAVAVAREAGVPVRFVGTGESADDLEPFDAERYVRDLLEEAS